MDYSNLNTETKTESLALDTTYSTSFLNMHKNRYENVLPPPRTRVIMSGPEGEDYINANYIRGFCGDKQYIAAQAPLKNTIGDWWRMIHEQKVQLIVMLTKLHENGRSKADIYWPEVGKSLFLGPYLIALNQEIHYSTEITLRYITLKCKTSPNVEQKIVQIHFSGWPDFGKPQNTLSFLQLIGFIESYRHYCDEKKQEEMEGLMDMDDDNEKIQAPPILLHCSAGIGRTGTLITCHTAWQILNETSNDNVNIRDIVKNLRRDRTGMVQSVEQYVFIHEVIDQLKECLGKGRNRQSERSIVENVKCNAYGNSINIEITKPEGSDPRPYPVQVRG